MEQYLYDKLINYSKTDYYPFHMPGHKRNIPEFVNPYDIDITEIDGFDNLHDAQEIIKESQDRCRQIFNSDYTFYIVNGSSAGILSAVSAVANPLHTVLIARNCHKSVYNVSLIRKINIEYVYPKILNPNIINLRIDADDIDKTMKLNKDIKTVVITSPTYEGIVSDIEAISKVVHGNKGILIVDEAHGAHFRFSDYFPKSALECGADIVIQSVHKTLPSFTQTALLHVKGKRVDIDKIKRYLSIYQSSSPSYILMSGIDRCMKMLESNGTELFDKYTANLKNFYKETKNLRSITILDKKMLGREIFDFDRGKIVICSNCKAITGPDIYNILRDKYHLQMEMESEKYVIAMTSIMDTKEGFERLINALKEIDEHYINEKSYTLTENKKYVQYPVLYKKLEIYNAVEKRSLFVNLDNSIGNISADYIYMYPPGIPIIVPGEIISKTIVDVIKKCNNNGVKIKGIKNNTKELQISILE